MSGALFKSKVGDKARREKNLRRSTLSFDAEEDLEERQQQQPRRATAVLSTADDHRASDDGDEGNGADVVKRAAPVRSHQHRRKAGARYKGAPLADAEEQRAGRRPAVGMAVGDDYDAPSEEARSAGSAGDGMYSKEALAALRNNAIHIGASAAPSTSPPSSGAPPSTTERPVVRVTDSSDDDETMSADATAQQQRMIRRARTQRARRRAMTEISGEDFIPLTPASASASSSVPHPQVLADDDDDDDVSVQRVVSRSAIIIDDDAAPPRTFARSAVDWDGDGDEHPTLLREDDTDDVVDVTNDAREVPGEDRLLFGDDGREQRRADRQKGIQSSLLSADRSQHGEDVDSELEEWEEEQLRKGGVRFQQAPRPREPISHRDLRAGVESRAPNPGQPAISSLSYAALHSSLVSHLSTLRQTQAATVAQSSTLLARLSALRERQAALQRKAEETEEAFVFYQEMRAWMSALLAMLAEKVEDIDEAWQEMTRMRARRGEQRAERRRLYRQDEADDAKGAASSDDVREVDDFGRDLGYVREVDRERRDEVRRKVGELIQAERRRRKAAAITAEALGKDAALYVVAEQMDGWESEDEWYEEAEGTASTTAAAFASFREDVSAIMSDVDAEWRDLHVVAGHLHHWKERYPAAYHDAFIALSVPRLLAPFVRLHLMTFDILPPLSSSPSPYASPFLLSSLSWYDALSRYASSPRAGDDDPDAALVASTVRALLCPLLLAVIKDEWDVSSEREGTRLRQALEQLQTVLGSSDDKILQAWTELRAAVEDRLRREVDDAVRMGWQPGEAAKSSDEAVRRWCVRSVKLLCAVQAWVPLSQACVDIAERQALSVVAAALRVMDGIQGGDGAVTEAGWRVLQLIGDVIARYRCPGAHQPGWLVAMSVTLLQHERRDVAALQRSWQRLLPPQPRNQRI